jgi:hypothetical protein
MQNDVNVQMNWFERHLNWTAAGMGVASAGLFLLLIWISFGFQFPYWENIVGYSLPVLIVLAILAIAWLVLTAYGYGWILYRKNRSPLFLLLFTPCLLMVAGTLIYKIFFYSTIVNNDVIINGEIYWEYSSLAGELVFAEIVLFGVIWLILARLHNKNLYASVIENYISKPQSHFWEQMYGEQKIVKASILVVSGINITLLVFAFSFISFGSLTYHSPEKEGLLIPPISFKYPANADEPNYYHTRFFKSGYPTSKDFRYGDLISFWRTSRISPSFELHVFSFNLINAESVSFDSDNYSEMILKQYDNPQEYQKVIIGETLVGNIPAHQISIFVDTAYIDDIDWNDFGNNTYIFFEYKDVFWVVSYHDRAETDQSPPPAFNHLLQTFKIYDE